MPDASAHSAPFETYDSQRYGKLSVTDRTLLLREFKKHAKADLVDSIKTAGLPPEQAYAEMRVFDLDVWGARRWIELVNSFAGQQDIFRAAIGKYEKDQAKIEEILGGLALTPAESVERACTLSCLPYEAPQNVPANMKQVGVINGKPVYAAAAGEATTSNPTGNPAAYGMPTETPSTSTETPAKTT